MAEQLLDGSDVGPAIVTAAVAGRDAADIVLRLRDRGINGGASPRKYGLLDMDAKGVPSVLRLSPHSYNTEAEVDAALDALAEGVRR